jgi:hypothetical protein
MKLLRSSRILGLINNARLVRRFLLITMLTFAVPSNAQVAPSAQEAAGLGCDRGDHGGSRKRLQPASIFPSRFDRLTCLR